MQPDRTRAFYAHSIRRAALIASVGTDGFLPGDAEDLREAARRLERPSAAERVCRDLLLLLIGSMIAIFSGAVHRLAASPAASIATAPPAMASHPAPVVEAGRSNPGTAR